MYCCLERLMLSSCSSLISFFSSLLIQPQCQKGLDTVHIMQWLRCRSPMLFLWSVANKIFKMRKCTALRDVSIILHPLYFSSTCGVTGNWGKHWLDFWENKVFEKLNLRYARSAPWSHTSSVLLTHKGLPEKDIHHLDGSRSFIPFSLFQMCKQQIP